MSRIVLWLMLCMVAAPVYADPLDDIAAAIFEGDPIKGDIITIKTKYRQCSSDTDCTAVLSVCRWRAVSKALAQYVANVSSQVQPECRWPPPPAVAPVARCMKNLCQIMPDGKYY